MTSRTEAIRKCRSINDIIEIISTVAADTQQVKATLRQMERGIKGSVGKKFNISLAARKISDQTITIRHGEPGGVRVTKQGKLEGDSVVTPTGHHILTKFVKPKK